MLLAKTIAAAKVAIEICNSHVFKKEIICYPESDYAIESDGNFANKRWGEIVDRKASIIVCKLGLPHKLQEEMHGLILLIVMRMLTWASYHENILDLSPEYTLKFLKPSFFTQRGNIDNKTAAEELIHEKNLSIKQKYKLACLYCLTEYIPVLYGQLARREKEMFCTPQDDWPWLYVYWSRMMDEFKEVFDPNSFERCGGTSVQRALFMAVEDGSKAAIEYLLDKTNLSTEEDSVVEAALQTLLIKEVSSYRLQYVHHAPSYHYVDNLCFLLSIMEKNQRIKFLQLYIGSYHVIQTTAGSRVLGYLLDWPYQDYFMRTANLMWESLPVQNYAELLLEILNKIDGDIGTHIKMSSNLTYYEMKSYDYRRLLTEFWKESPERYKKHVLRDEKTDSGHTVSSNKSKNVLVNLFELKNFTYEDWENIKIILASASNLEKEHIFSKEGYRICISLMKNGRWETLHEFVSTCVFDKEKSHEFKRKFVFTEEAQNILIDSALIYKRDAFESFVKWSALSEEEVVTLKTKLTQGIEDIYACAH